MPSLLPPGRSDCRPLLGPLRLLALCLRFLPPPAAPPGPLMSASLALAASLGPFPLSIPWTEAAGRQNRQSRQRTKAETGRQGRAVRMCACVCIQCAWLGPLLTSLALCLLPSSLRLFLPPPAVCLPPAATRLPGGWLLSTLPASQDGPVDSTCLARGFSGRGVLQSCGAPGREDRTSESTDFSGLR